MNDYRDVYVSDCGQDFPSRIQGLEHERDCDRCEEIRRRREVDRDAEDIIEAVRSLEAAKEQFSDELRERARDGGDGWGMEQYERNVREARDRLEHTLTTYINDRIAAYLEAHGK